MIIARLTRAYLRALASAPDASVVPIAAGDLLALLDATEPHRIKAAIGGAYSLPDGRQFWLDAVAVSEILRRLTDMQEACKR